MGIWKPIEAVLRREHLEVKYHFIKHLIEIGSTSNIQIPTKDVKADVLKLPFGASTFRLALSDACFFAQMSSVPVHRIDWEMVEGQV